MVHNDKNEERLKAAFSSFEPKPPERVWENICKELHPEVNATANPVRIHRPILPVRPLYLYASMVAAVILLFILVVYFSSYGRHAIRGFAYTGEVNLCKGTAILFKVEDKALPRDSVRHYKSALVDKDGFYQFLGVEPGNYLLRVIPVKNEGGSVSYLPSWHEQHATHHEASLIDVESEDVNADVHLIKVAK